MKHSKKAGRCRLPEIRRRTESVVVGAYALLYGIERLCMTMQAWNQLG